jgi:hypothetical protein
MRPRIFSEAQGGPTFGRRPILERAAAMLEDKHEVVRVVLLHESDVLAAQSPQDFLDLRLGLLAGGRVRIGDRPLHRPLSSRKKILLRTIT